MIVDPDFFDHWRTRMVADMLNDAMAPVYIMRLWAHCQNRKGDVFDIPPAGVKALCSFSGDAQALEAALIAAEYMSRDGKSVTVIGWAEKNASLISAWSNGSKGGRPKKTPPHPQQAEKQNPEETHGLPVDNPSLTQAKAIREDKRREEKNTPIPPSKTLGAPSPKPAVAVSLPAWLATVKAKGEKPIPDDDPVFDYAEQANIPMDLMRLCWVEFRARYSEPNAKRYKDWRSVYRKAVRGNWLKLWFLTEDGYGLTTAGQQAQRALDAKQGVAA